MQKILIVEDDQAISAMYEYKIKKEGYRVAFAYSGTEGYQLCKTMQPDVLLLDLHMPGLHGDALLEKIRKQSWGADIKTIILTNISKNEAPMKLRLLGVERYIIKAHSAPGQVAQVIAEVLAKYQSKPITS